jgi:hypothetical protein
MDWLLEAIWELFWLVLEIFCGNSDGVKEENA